MYRFSIICPHLSPRSQYVIFVLICDNSLAFNLISLQVGNLAFYMIQSRTFRWNLIFFEWTSKISLSCHVVKAYHCVSLQIGTGITNQGKENCKSMQDVFMVPIFTQNSLEVIQNTSSLTLVLKNDQSYLKG